MAVVAMKNPQERLYSNATVSVSGRNPPDLTWPVLKSLQVQPQPGQWWQWKGIRLCGAKRLA